ncbi:MAG: Holliday junction branch migration protein RuvA [Oscillospiraceae bacterium]
MFYYIEGTVTIIEQNAVVLDTGGVGFLCYTTVNTLSHLEIGAKARLYTYCNIREDAFDIYGFYDAGEKRCFEMLLSVSGVGPKAAVSILSSATPEGIALAVVTENEKMLTSAPGIGKRIAQRIILELKDKIAKEKLELNKAPIPQAAPSAAGKKLSDVTAALSVLGYSPAEISLALREIDIDKLSVEEAVKLVLKGSVK